MEESREGEKMGKEEAGFGPAAAKEKESEILFELECYRDERERVNVCYVLKAKMFQRSSSLK